MSNCAIEVMVLRDEQRVLPTIWSVSDELWKQIKPILNQYDPLRVVGRKPIRSVKECR